MIMTLCEVVQWTHQSNTSSDTVYTERLHWVLHRHTSSSMFISLVAPAVQ